MSTLTVCPYCGEGMRFDAMKAHVDACEERSPLVKSRPHSPSKRTMLSGTAAAEAPALSGLDFYNQLNKLSRLGRQSRSGSRGSVSADRHHPFFNTSTAKEDAAVVQRLLYPPSSLTIDVAPSSPPVSAASSLGLLSAALRHRPSPSSAAGSSVSPTDQRSPARPPWPSPPAVKLDLRNTDAASAVSVARSRSASSTRQSRDALGERSGAAAAAAAAAVRGSTGRAPHVAMTSSSSSSSGSDNNVGAAVLNSQYVVAGTTAPPSARRATVAGVAEATDRTAAARLQSGQRADSGGAEGASRSTTSGYGAPAGGPSSRASSTRPTPQLSSFAIRVSGDKRSPRLGVGGGPRQPLQSQSSDGDGAGGASTAQMRASLQQLQRLLRHQQEQYSALLRAHGDIHKQVAAQQRANDELVRRSTAQSAAVEAALQKHAAQWRREQATLQQSVAALSASVADIQQHLQRGAGVSPKVLAAPPIALASPPLPSQRDNSDRLDAGWRYRSSSPFSSQLVSTPVRPSGGTQRPPEASILVTRQCGATAQDSTYYSDIASFIRPDAAPASSLSTSFQSRHGAAVEAEHVPASTYATRVVHGVAVASADKKGAANPVNRSSAPALGSPYLMDVQHQHQQQPQQQQRRESMEDRVIAMLRSKPTVVIPHNPWA